jgi:ribosome-associated protein
MAVMSSSRDAALTAARCVADHKGEDTVVLDIAEVSSIADFFVVATARSSTHLAGLARELSSVLHALGRSPRNRHKGRTEKGWLLLDCGDLVIHLMEKEQREFYDLERLWFKAVRVTY